MSGILKYFRPVKNQSPRESLPNPHGPLNTDGRVPSSAIASANIAVEAVLVETPDATDSSSGAKSRGRYQHLTPAQKFKIGKRASELGVTNALRYYKSTFPKLALKETSVRRFKNLFQQSSKRPRSDSSEELSELPNKKMGRPLLIGEELDRQVQEYLRYLREQGSAVNSAIAIATAEGVVRSVDANLLACNGGGINLTKPWARGLLGRMGMVKRRASSKAKVSVEDFEVKKKEFLLEVKNVVSFDEIPPPLIINWDQTGIHYIPVSSWTMEKEGTKRIELAGKEDKRQLTAVLAGSMAGDFLPPQIVYQGKTSRCLPHVDFPDGWHVTYSANHWCNEITMKDYINKIILPYVKQKREELMLAVDYPAVVIFDNFKAQCTSELLTILDDNNINVILIPANCTDRLQPLDISVNKAVKDFLRSKFQEWFAKQVKSQLSGETAKAPVDLRLSVVKPEGARWMISMCDYLKSKPEIISNGFKDIKGSCLN